MNTIFSIRNTYTSLIFSGAKNVEFRKRIGKDMCAGSVIFIYETRAAGGAGAVIGHVTIKTIEEIPNYKIGTYFLMPYYAELYGTLEEKQLVSKAMQIKLNSHCNSLVCRYVLDEQCLDEMLTTHEPPDSIRMALVNSKEHDAAWEATNRFLNNVDKWGKKIGYYNELDISQWQYAISISNPKKYSVPKSISSFVKQDGKPFAAAPQSWAYTLNDN